MVRARSVSLALVLASGIASVASARAEAAAPALDALRTSATPAAPGSGEPCLAQSPDGTVFLTWFERRDSTRHALRFARLEGQHWSKPATIAEGDSFFVNWADVPRLAALDRDHLVAAWAWKSGRGAYAYDVRIAQSLDGGRTWGAPTIPHRDGTATEHGFVSLLPSGDAVRAVWLDGRKGAGDSASAGHDEESHAEMTLRTAVIDSAGGLSDERELDGRVCDCCPIAAVATARGTLIAYRDRGLDERRDIGVIRGDEGGWSEPAPVHVDGWTIAACPVNGPAVDARDAWVVAAWFTMAADTPRVQVAFSSDAGRSFGAPLRVDGGDPLGRVSVALLDDGSALVTWLEAGRRDAAFQVRRVWPDGRLGSALTVARTAGTRASGIPRIVRSGRTVVLAWTEPGKPPRVRVATARVP